ncbi:MAG: TonB family protein [Thiobacillus sp.]|nr:TonB family protein [Thiobacillus sp.]
MNDSLDEPTIPPQLWRPLAAVWISLGLHAALIALVQVVPPAALNQGETVIEARLVTTHTASSPVAPPPPEPDVAKPGDTAKEPPLLVPSDTAEALPVATPPAEPRPSVTATPPADPPADPRPATAPPVAPAPVATITSSVDLTYYSARDLDTQPRALREIVPDYPADADRQRQSGKVRLQLKLEADGRVSDIDLVSATPPGMFEDSAIRAFRDARFAPAQKNGRPVRALVLIEVEYDWEGRR